MAGTRRCAKVWTNPDDRCIELLSRALGSNHKSGVTPTTNQIERHPYFHNNELVECNRKHGIVTEAWSPLGREINDVLTNDTILSLAKKYQRQPAQIIIRWNLRNGVLPIVKSSNYAHQQANLTGRSGQMSQ